MNNKLIILSIYSLFLVNVNLVQAQPKQAVKTAKPTAAKPVTVEDPVLLQIDGKPVTKSEFLAIYKKNNKNTQINQKELQEYLDLFINFKLKVREAEQLGFDTLQTFKNELEGYKKQLAQPYLVDNDVNDQLIKEAYDRMKTEIRASHILINCAEEALPKDTIKAYEKAMEIRGKILKGADFAEEAKKNSDDPSAKENGGDLGYFTALQMVYPFENAAYNGKVGDITTPVRTRFGYHIIKIADKRDAQGQITVAHIMVKSNKNSTQEEQDKAKEKINEIAAKLKKGDDFASLAKQFSDDKGSANKGGELPMFGTGRMVPEFEKVSFSLKNNGDISEPFLTNYGWHIVKRISKKELGTFDEMKNELKVKITKDSRSQKSKDSKIAKIKKENGFSEMPNNRAEIYPLMDSTFIQGNWKSENVLSKLNKNMFKIGNATYTQKDFAKYLETQQSKRAKGDIKPIVDEIYKKFVVDKCLAFEETQLEKKYPEYRLLMQEYKDGILLFDLTDKKVWSAAMKDSTGLNNYYQQNKNKYMWDERVQAVVYSCKNDSVANAVRNMLNPPKVEPKKKKKGKEQEEIKPLTEAEILAAINKNSQLNLKIERAKFSKGENEAVDKAGKQKGLSENMKINNQVVFVNVEDVLMPQPKTISEARGIITADYQSQLEKQWISTLKEKYKVEINSEVLNSIK